MKVVKEIVKQLVDNVAETEELKVIDVKENGDCHIKIEVSNCDSMDNGKELDLNMKLDIHSGDIDALVAQELSQLSLSRKQRSKNNKMKRQIRENWDVQDLLQHFDIPSTSKVEIDQEVKLNSDVFQTLRTITKISERIPESNDDLDDYRLSVAIFTISQLTDVNKELCWKVQALGQMLNRSLREIKFFKVALARTSGELKDEVELLRKTTMNTLKRIIESDLARKEKMQVQWAEVKTFIHKKNKRINELTEQLNRVDVDIGFLLASHKERIEAACVAERNYFQAAEKVEDLEVELKQKTKLLESRVCSKCNSQGETDEQRKDREARETKRLEQRKQFEMTEKQKFADAQKVGAALQKHVQAAYENLGPKGNAPWHNGSDKANKSDSQPMFKAGHVPLEMFEVLKLRLEEKEQEVATHERMNQIITKDLEKCQQEQEASKVEISELKDKNEEYQKKIDELSKQLEESKKQIPNPQTISNNNVPKITVTATGENQVKNVVTPIKKQRGQKQKGVRKPSKSPEHTFFRQCDRKRVAPPPLAPPCNRPPHPPPYYREGPVPRLADKAHDMNMHFSVGFRAPMSMTSMRNEGWNGNVRPASFAVPSLLPPTRHDGLWNGPRNPAPNGSSWITSRR
ncbi:unnamed protein product [Bursaphelenchus okinawaensis]|uniref:Uncharacterized protein n=1 Tax=Bursaphelenchus okinawaensis TaxID=465554 RepID=A0A811KBA0_9BILA|nr:unnamed protein product [Bursaphelenchus okinawaensis]CAG9095301.1 unnamed protein product [Bursaphelenchus okinawaensis]